MKTKFILFNTLILIAYTNTVCSTIYTVYKFIYIYILYTISLSQINKFQNQNNFKAIQ